MSTQLIFLFSLPRSGSTLLQRLLASHNRIATLSEPWILLPFLYALKPYGVFSEYSHITCFKAIQDFIEELPNSEEDYFRSLGIFANSLYEKVAESRTKYFLDKTPRYYLIIPEIAKLFPDAKFIFLFRNPIQQLSSIVETWNRGTLRLTPGYIDLFKGPSLLAEGYEQLKQKSISVDYDELVIDPENTLRDIFNYLKLDYKESVIPNFSNLKLKGRMGDSVDTLKYDKIERNRTEKWKKTFNTKYRKKYAIKYLSKLGHKTLKSFGYNLDDLIKEVDKIQPSKIGWLTDRFNVLIGSLYRTFEIPLFKRKIEGHFKHKIKFHGHT